MKDLPEKILNNLINLKTRNVCLGHGFSLILMPHNLEDEEQWMVYTPDYKVLTAGPSKWFYEPSS